MSLYVTRSSTHEEVGARGEGAATEGTQEGSLSIVHALVGQQGAPRDKLTVTNGTGEGLCLPVTSLVLPPRAALHERVSTHAAHERLLTGVEHSAQTTTEHVTPEMTCHNKIVFIFNSMYLRCFSVCLKCNYRAKLFNRVIQCTHVNMFVITMAQLAGRHITKPITHFGT